MRIQNACLKSAARGSLKIQDATRNVGQCPTWWPPCRIWVAPSLQCRAVTPPRCETRWNLQGCFKLTKRSQPLVGRSSPYCWDMWRRYCCLTIFFRLSTCALFAKT